MPLPFMRKFHKTARCPSSQTLLAYRRRLSIKDRVAVEVHLSSCDFCSAELQLLTRHRYRGEESSMTEIPASLRRLAEDILRTARPFKQLEDLAETRQLSH